MSVIYVSDSEIINIFHKIRSLNCFRHEAKSVFVQKNYAMSLFALI